MDTWSNLCRCCLSPYSEVSLFDSAQNVREKFLEITTLEVTADDGLPQKLCTDCYTVLNSAYQFRKQCIKMDSELKFQLETYLSQAEEESDKHKEEFANTEMIQMEDSSANDTTDITMKQLEDIIKTEPNDSDDDYYYVLVIDPKDKEAETDNETLLSEIKVEHETGRHISEQSAKENFENSIDSFLNTKVSADVPATILENEEESQDGDALLHAKMDIDETQDSNSQDLPHIEDSQENTVDDMAGTVSGEIVDHLPNSKNSFIKILTSRSADGTILLKSGDAVTYSTDINDEGDPGTREEVIFCEGDDSSQFQILNCEGSELVIEYADDGQIATVLQQEDGTFLCDCGEQFEDLADYEKHQYTHNPAGEHLCNLCGKGFESAEILTGHTLLHNVTGLLIVCPFCDQLIKRNNLTQHIKYGHNNIKPRCAVCYKTFANPNNLKRHMMIHSGVRQFECDVCFKRFHQKITMQTHRLTHANPFACNECDDAFDDRAALAAHKDSGECSRSKVAKVKEELMKTIKREITTDLGELLGYACSLCKKMFSVEAALERHVESAHVVDPAELLCAECGEILPSRRDMQAHALSHGAARAKLARRFECGVCRKGCASQAMLVMHERVHTNERPFPCQLCALRFKTKTHLRTHQLTHTREKKFGCSVCMKFFALKGNLVVHLRTHTGERPYVCSLCGDAFIDSKYLKKHKLKKHAIDNVPWNKY